MSLSGVQTRIRSTRGSVGEADGRRGDGVVGLELDHRPEDDPERLDRGLGDRELGEQLGRHARPTTCSPGTGRCGTTRSPGPWRSRRASRPPRAAGRAAARTSPDTPDRTIPSRPRTGGRGAKCARNSSYVASTRWISTGSLSSRRAGLDELPQALEVGLEDAPQDRREEPRRRGAGAPGGTSVSDQRTIVVAAVGAGIEPDVAVAAEAAVVPDGEPAGRLERRDRDRVERPHARRCARRPPPASRRRSRPALDPDGLHVVHPAGLALDVGERSSQTALDRARAMTTDVRIGGGGAPSARSRQDPVGDPRDGRRRRAPARRTRPDHAIGRLERRTPAVAQLVEGPVAVARLEVDGGDGVGRDGRPEAEPERVERGRLDAVVGRQADDDDRLDAAVAEDVLELGRDRLAGDRVAHREAGVAVLAVGALADARRVVGQRERRVELRAPRAADAVDRPDAAVAWRNAGVCSGCQSWVATTRAPAAWAASISRLTAAMIAIATGDATGRRRGRRSRSGRRRRSARSVGRNAACGERTPWRAGGVTVGALGRRLADQCRALVGRLLRRAVSTGAGGSTSSR